MTTLKWAILTNDTSEKRTSLRHGTSETETLEHLLFSNGTTQKDNFEKEKLKNDSSKKVTSTETYQIWK